MSEAKPVSFAGLKINNTAELDVIDPRTLQPSGWKVTLASMAHPKVVAWLDKMRAENLAKLARIEAQQANRRKIKPDAKTVEQDKEDTAAWLVARTIGWTPVDFGQGTVEYSDEAAAKIFMDPSFDWVTRQIVDFLDNEAAFIEGSAKK